MDQMEPIEARPSSTSPDGVEKLVDVPAGPVPCALTPQGSRTSDITDLRGDEQSVTARVFKYAVENFFTGFFPYRFDAQRAVIPIDPHYEPRLVERVGELASTVGDPQFAEKVREIVLRDLYEENPHLISNPKGFGQLGLSSPDPAALTLTGEQRSRVEELFQIRERIIIPDLRKVPVLGKLIPYSGKRERYIEVDVVGEFERTQSLPEKALLLILAMRHGLLHMDPAVDLVLRTTTELAQAGRFREAVNLMTFAMERGPVWWSSRVCVLVDQMAKVHFAAGDFVRAEMKFEEVARHGRFVDNSRPFNFHLGMIKLANGDVPQAKWFLEKTALGFHSSETREGYSEALGELLSRIGEHRRKGMLMLPELE